MKRQALITIFFLLIVVGRAAGQCIQTGGALSQEVCEGLSIDQILISEGTATSSFFSFTGTGLSTSFDPVTRTLTIAGIATSSGDYTAKLLKDASDLCTYTGTITVNTNPTITIATAETSGLTDDDGIVCAGDQVTLTASGGTSYSWNPVIANGTPFTPVASATYEVTVTDGNGCTATGTKSITVNTNPTVTIETAETSGLTDDDGIVCAGDQVTLTASGGTSYSWNPVIVNGTPFTPVASDTYEVTVTDGNGCTATGTKSITVNSLPSPSVSGSNNVCVLSTQTYSTAAGKTDYLWTITGGSKVSGGGLTNNSVTINWPTAGAGSVSVNYKESGCHAVAPTDLGVIINPKPIPTDVSVHLDAGELLKQFVTIDVSYSYTAFPCPDEVITGTRITWYRADNASGLNSTFITTKPGTDKTYTLSLNDVGKFIQVRVEASDGITLSAPVSSAWNGPVQANEKPEATNLNIIGIPSVGNELTADFDYSDDESDDEGAHLYKWYANGTEISKAISSTYTIVKADRGKVITFSVQPVALTGSSPGVIVTSPGTASVGDQAPEADNVSFSGELRVGKVLTGNYRYSDNEGDPESGSVYQWFSGSSSGALTPITGADKISFILTNEQFTGLTNYIAFSVKPMAEAGSPEGVTVTSTRQGPVLNPAPTASFPASPITGVKNVNELLTGHYIYSDAEGDLEGSSSYVWESSPNGTSSWIPAGSGISHLISELEQGKYFRFRVNPRAATGTLNGLEYVSASYGPVNSKPYVDGVEISGASTVGTELTGNYNFQDIDGDLVNTYMFSWLRDGVTIPGETSNKYVLTYEDEGKHITFRVIPIALTGFLTGDPVSVSTAAVTDPNTDVPDAINLCIEGSRVVDQVLRGKYTYTHHRPELNSEFKWFRNDIEIPGANSVEYVVKSEDADAKITFAVRPRSSNIPQRGDLWFTSQEFPKITGLESQYGLNAGDVILSTNLGPPDGYFTGKGISGTTFSPSNAGEGTWEINYFRTYLNGTNTCPQRTPQSVVISADIRTFMPAMATKYCSYDPPFTVVVTPSDFLPFTSSVECIDEGNNPDMAGITWDGLYSITVDPSKFRNGKHSLIYYYSIRVTLPLPIPRILTLHYKIKHDFTIVTVRKDTRFIGLKDKYCKNADDQILSVEGINALVGTGTWQWEGVAGDGTLITDEGIAAARFIPKNANAGRKYIKYQYSFDGCVSNPLREPVDIYNTPDATFQIDDYYNIDGPDQPLAPNDPANTGGIFSGEGVSGSLLIPSLAVEGPATIKYTFTDANLCTGTWTENTTFRKARGTISGINDVVCYDNINLTLSAAGVPVNGVDGVVSYKGFSNKRGTLTPVPNTTSAVYSLPALVEGEDVITFSYVWDEVDFSISKTVKIDNLGTVSIYNLEQDQDVCDDLLPFKLTVSKPGGVFTGLVNGENFDPKAGTANWVKYTYINSETGCSISTTVNVNVHKAPTVDFIPYDVCINDESDTLRFMNKTNSIDPVVKWKWEFDDEGTVRMDSSREAGYLYLKGGLQQIALTAETDKGCVVRKEKTINIGRRPEADFYWKKDCYYPNESLLLLDATKFSTPPKSYSWKSGNRVFGTSNNAALQMTDTGFVKIEYIVRTDYFNCHDTVVKNVYIRPTIKIPADGYFQDFEAGKGGWTKGDTSTIWSFGFPAGQEIKSAASGQHAWYTASAKDGSSSVESPCFDLSSTSRPSFKLEIWKDFNKERDGVVLQYRVGDDTEWRNVGRTLDDGIQWYNSTAINGKPGGSQLGWTTAGASDDKYLTAIHTLDELKGKKDVRFRFAYGSSGSYSERDGFAFDDIFIGERSRQVLMEHFTSYQDAVSTRYKPLVDSIANHLEGDVINIQYHSDIAGTDSLFVHNPGEINARTLYYGLTKVPYTFIDGGSGENHAAIFDYRLSVIDSNVITKRSLMNSPFRLFIDPVISGRVLNIKGYIRAIENLQAENLTLFLAVTEKTNAGNFEGVNASETFINVFRKFIPDAGGIILKPKWIVGDSIALPEKSWIIDKALNSSDIEIIAFVQNTTTQEVHQAFSVIKPDITTGIEDGLLREGRFSMYPNPASNRITVGFPDPLRSEADIRIYNFQGELIREYRAGAGLTEFTIEDPGLKAGIYLVRVSRGILDLGYRKLIITED